MGMVLKGELKDGTGKHPKFWVPVEVTWMIYMSLKTPTVKIGMGFSTRSCLHTDGEFQGKEV